MDFSDQTIFSGTRSGVTGSARYTADYSWPDMWSAVVVRSPHPKARVMALKAAEALAVPEVEEVFSAADVPDRPFATGGHPLSLTAPQNGADRADKRLLTDRPRHQGDEVAVVVARSPEAARRGAGLVRIEYEIEDSAGSIASAGQEAVPLVDQNFDRNLFFRTSQRSGPDNPAGEHLAVEASFETQVMQHVPLETPAALAWLDEEGRLVVVSSTQVPHLLPRLLSQVVDRPESRIRIIKPRVGGGFGCKQDLILEPLAAWLTIRLKGRPIKIIQSRRECFLASRTRHAFKGQGRAVVEADGFLSALELKVQAGIGAYAAHGHSIAGAAGARLPALYPRADISYEAESLFSNTPVAGAFRGFGFPQVTFMAESLVDEAAYAAGHDPLDFRLANVVREGQYNYLDKQTITPAALYDCLVKGRELFNWPERQAEAARQQGPLRRGLGVACFAYTTGTYPFYPEPAGARLTLREDGRIMLAAGAVEIGQRSDEALVLLAARFLNIEPGQICLAAGQDTDYSPYLAGAYASRQTAFTAEALKAAAGDFTARLLNLAGTILNISRENLELSGVEVVNRNCPAQKISLARLAEAAYYHPDIGRVISAEAALKVRRNQTVYGCSLVDLEVDLPLCRLSVKEVLNVHDSGSIVHRQGAEGQVYGGQMMGLAMALGEEMLFDREGRARNNDLLNYKVPLAGDIKLSCAFVEKTSQDDFEPRSLGEAPSIPVAAALGNALRAATGLRLTALPFSPPRLFPHFARINFGRRKGAGNG